MSGILSPSLFAAFLSFPTDTRSFSASLLLFCLSFSGSLSLMKLPAKCPFVLINHSGSKKAKVFVSGCQMSGLRNAADFASSVSRCVISKFVFSPFYGNHRSEQQQNTQFGSKNIRSF